MTPWHDEFSHVFPLEDGANVGFNVMSYSTRKIFSYRQIQAVVSPYIVGKCLMPRRSPCSGYITLFQAQVNNLEAYGERPLVILPHKYSKPGFLIGSRYQQNLNKEEMKILEEYANHKILGIICPDCSFIFVF